MRCFRVDILGALCTVLGSILVRGAPFWGCFWCAVRRFGLDFGARCAVFGSILGVGAPFWARILVNIRPGFLPGMCLKNSELLILEILNIQYTQAVPYW